MSSPAVPPRAAPNRPSADDLARPLAVGARLLLSLVGFALVGAICTWLNLSAVGLDPEPVIATLGPQGLAMEGFRRLLWGLPLLLIAYAIGRHWHAPGVAALLGRRVFVGALTGELLILALAVSLAFDRDASTVAFVLFGVLAALVHLAVRRGSRAVVAKQWRTGQWALDVSRSAAAGLAWGLLVVFATEAENDAARVVQILFALYLLATAYDAEIERHRTVQPPAKQAKPQRSRPAAVSHAAFLGIALMAVVVVALVPAFIAAPLVGVLAVVFAFRGLGFDASKTPPRDTSLVVVAAFVIAGTIGYAASAVRRVPEVAWQDGATRVVGGLLVTTSGDHALGVTCAAPGTAAYRARWMSLSHARNRVRGTGRTYVVTPNLEPTLLDVLSGATREDDAWRRRIKTHAPAPAALGPEPLDGTRTLCGEEVRVD